MKCAAQLFGSRNAGRDSDTEHTRDKARVSRASYAIIDSDVIEHESQVEWEMALTHRQCSLEDPRKNRHARCLF